MGLKDCIDRAVAAGEMDPARAQQAKALYDELEAEFIEALGPDAGAVRAAQETVKLTRQATATRSRQATLQMQAQARLRAGLAQAPDRAEAALATIDATGVRGLSYRAAEQERKVVLGLAHAKMADAIEHHRRTLGGRTRDKAGELDMLREAFGEQTGNASAAAFARGWHDTAEFLRNAFNAAGGHIGKLEKWGLPQSHDTVMVRQARFEEWHDFIWPKLDRDRMIDRDTGRPFTDGKLTTVLHEVYDTIRTDGWSKRKPSGQAAGRSMANRHTDPRFLHFRSADDWLIYDQRFGTDAGAFSTMLTHIDVMAREIGAMRALGPNPSATIRFLEQDLRKTAAELDFSQPKANGIERRLKRSAAHLQVLYDNYTGSVNAPSDGQISRFFQTTRGLLTSAQLGGAFLSSLSDQWTLRMASAHAGLPTAKVLKGHWKLFLPGSIEDKKFCVRAGLIAEEWSQVASAQMRYVGEVAGAEWARTVADIVMRVTGLSPWTQSHRWIFGKEFLGALGHYAHMAFRDLPSPLRRTLHAYRIDADAWDTVRATKLYEYKGATFLIPDDVRLREDLAPDVREELATRLLAMVQSETEYAVPSASLRGRAAVGGNVPPGTILGEVARSGLMYKSFAVTMYFTHIRRAAQQQGGWNKARYTAELVTGATLMGALTIGLKDIARGRDPRDMTTPEFWGQAMAQGGGLGIFGDFFLTDYSRYGQSLGATLAGPVAGAAGDLLGLGQKAAKGEDIGADAVRLLGRYTPGSSIWYGRLLLERLVLDQIQARIDPDHARRWRNLQLRHERELGTKYFWRRGTLAPQRQPSLSNAGGRQ